MLCGLYNPLCLPFSADYATKLQKLPVHLLVRVRFVEHNYPDAQAFQSETGSPLRERRGDHEVWFKFDDLFYIHLGHVPDLLL